MQTITLPNKPMALTIPPNLHHARGLYRILAEAIKSSPNDLELGIGRYHSWNEERARWYGQRVLSIYRNILHELEVRQ